MDNSQQALGRLPAIIPAVLLLVLSALLLNWTNFAAGAIAGGAGLAWAALERVLGPTARSRICTTGTSVELPLVRRTRRARKVLAKIDAAVRVARGGAMQQPTAPIDGSQPAKLTSQTTSEEAPAAAPIEDLT